MSKNLDIKGLIGQSKKILPAFARHVPFAAIIIILSVYLFTVWRISQLASAEPTPEQEAAVLTQIPKIDEEAIKQIEALEQSNTEIKSLFNSARNNPFQE